MLQVLCYTIKAFRNYSEIMVDAVDDHEIEIVVYDPIHHGRYLERYRTRTNMPREISRFTPTVFGVQVGEATQIFNKELLELDVVYAVDRTASTSQVTFNITMAGPSQQFGYVIKDFDGQTTIEQNSECPEGMVVLDMPLVFASIEFRQFNTTSSGEIVPVSERYLAFMQEVEPQGGQTVTLRDFGGAMGRDDTVSSVQSMEFYCTVVLNAGTDRERTVILTNQEVLGDFLCNATVTPDFPILAHSFAFNTLFEGNYSLTDYLNSQAHTSVLRGRDFELVSHEQLRAIEPDRILWAAGHYFTAREVAAADGQLVLGTLSWNMSKILPEANDTRQMSLSLLVNNRTHVAYTDLLGLYGRTVTIHESLSLLCGQVACITLPGEEMRCNELLVNENNMTCDGVPVNHTGSLVVHGISFTIVTDFWHAEKYSIVSESLVAAIHDQRFFSTLDIVILSVQAVVLITIAAASIALYRKKVLRRKSFKEPVIP